VLPKLRAFIDHVRSHVANIPRATRG